MRRLINVVTTMLVRAGLGNRHTHILTVIGRKSGREYSTPVHLIENGERWLVAPYGEVGWVRNARAAGAVKLARARHTETLRVVEVPAEVAAPVLKRYFESVAVTRPFFDVDADSSLDEFIAEAPRHPVFRLDPQS